MAVTAGIGAALGRVVQIRRFDGPTLNHGNKVELLPSKVRNNAAFELSALIRAAQGITFGPSEYTTNHPEAMSSDSHSRLSPPSMVGVI